MENDDELEKLNTLVSMYNDEEDENYEDAVSDDETFYTAPVGKRRTTIMNFLNESSRMSAADKTLQSSHKANASPFPTTNAHLLRQTIATQTTPNSLRLSAMAVGNSVQQAVSKSNIFDPFFAISVRNSRVELSTFTTYCSEYRKYRLTQLHPEKPPQGEWITMGVIVEKTEQRKSANSNNYMIWQLHDLINCQLPPVKVLLFGDCLKEHWKIQPGMVVAITHAQYGDSTNNKKSTAVQVIDLGFCPDFGHCKGMKIDGNPCTMFVNTSEASHCAYHVRQAAKKLAARRGAFNTPYSQLPKVLEVSTPKSLAQQPGLYALKQKANAVKVSNNDNEIKQEEKKQLTTILQSNSSLPGARNLLKLMSKNHQFQIFDEQNVAGPSTASKSMKDFISSQFQVNSNSSIQSNPKIVLSQKENFARQNAARIMQTSNQTSNNSTPRKRPLAITSAEHSSENSVQPIKKSRLGGGFTDEQIQKLLEKKSTHEKETDEEDRRREDQYFTGMEAQEKIETHLTNLKEIKNVKVITCKKCKYTSEKQSSYCKINGHLVTIHKADKRFYRCKNCHTRTVTYELMPANPCNNCNGTKYERVAMRDERKVVADGEKLLLRGIEEKYLN